MEKRDTDSNRKTEWLRATADRWSLLHDSATYFSHLSQAFRRARRRIWIAGWDLHSKLRLTRSDDESPDLASLLSACTERRPELEVYILVWDWNALMTVARETFQPVSLNWKTRPRVRYQMDSRHPAGACHHEKLVVIDDSVAFAGGIDLTARRWDTIRHDPDDPRRVDPSGTRYPPVHDIQVAVSGPIAVALGDHVRERWQRATGESIAAVGPVTHDPWPPELAADLEDVSVGFARTRGPLEDVTPLCEIESLYRKVIGNARRYIYIENQYLTSDAIRRALGESLRRERGPEVIVVVPERLDGWLEESMMGALRARLVDALSEDDKHDRLRVLFPEIEGLGDEAVFVHSKLCVADDRWVIVGSANLANRSMRLDTECALVLEADSAGSVRDAIVTLRNHRLAALLRVDDRAFADALSERDGLIPTVEALTRPEDGLRPLDVRPESESQPMLDGAAILDPEKPVQWSDLLSMLAGAERD